MADAPSWADDIVTAPVAPAPWADPVAAPVTSLFAPAASAAPLDKYQQAARDEYARNPALAKLTGYTGRAGMGIPWSDEIQAGLLTPFEMLRQGTLNPAEAYRYAKARENLIGAQTRENTAGVGGTLAELSGGLATGAGTLGSGTRAATAIGKIPAGAVNYGRNVGKAAGLGAVYGAGEGDTLEDRTRNALIGGAFGGTLGAALPAVTAAVGPAARLLQIPRLRDPEKIALEQIAETARNAGVAPATIPQRLADAQAAGQPYTVADVLGKEGQRKLAAMAKVPGAQRDLITETLMARDLNMPSRVGGEIGQALGAPGTAAQATAALTQKAKTEAAPYYRKAEQARPIWNEEIASFLNEPSMQPILQHGVKMQRQESLLGGRPFNPHDYGITGFNAAGDPIISAVPNMKTLHAAKVGLDSMIDAQKNPLTGEVTNQGRILQGVQRRLLQNIDALNPDYAKARALYAGPMAVREAVRVGSTLPNRGRAIDNITQFNRFNPTAQQGARIGYADTVLKQLERTGNLPTLLREKSLKGANELEALSLYQGPNLPGAPSQLRQRLSREEQMQRTSRAALGGSATAENLADIAAGPGGAQVLGLGTNVASGNFIGALKNAADIAQRFGKGESEAQRMAITRQLLQTSPDAARALADRLAAYELRRRGVNPFVNRPPRYPAGP